MTGTVSWAPCLVSCSGVTLFVPKTLKEPCVFILQWAPQITWPVRPHSPHSLSQSNRGPKLAEARSRAGLL